MPIYAITYDTESGDEGKIGIVEADHPPTTGQVYAWLLEHWGCGGDMLRVHRKSCPLESEYDTECDCPIVSWMYINIEEIETVELPQKGEVSFTIQTGSDCFFGFDDMPVFEDVKDKRYDDQKKEWKDYPHGYR